MRRFPLLMILLTVIPIGCGKEESKPEPVAPSAPVSVTAFDLLLRPEHPPTTGCLEAIVSGPMPAEGVRWQVNGQDVAGQNQTTFCREYFRRGDEVSAQVVSGGKSVRRSLKASNAPPRITDVTFTADNSSIKSSPIAADADGDSVSFRYEWLINGEPDPFLTEAGVPRSRIQIADKLQVRIVPSDGFEDGPTYTSRQFSSPNMPPAIVSRPPRSYDAYEYSYQVKATDAENDKLTYSLVTPPAGMTINKNTGKIVWPLKEVYPGKYQIKIVVKDSAGGETRQEFELALGEPEGQ